MFSKQVSKSKVPKSDHVLVEYCKKKYYNTINKNLYNIVQRPDRLPKNIKKWVKSVKVLTKNVNILTKYCNKAPNNKHYLDNHIAVKHSMDKSFIFPSSTEEFECPDRD